MPRNFGVSRVSGSELDALIDPMLDEPAREGDPIWPFVLIGAVLAMILSLGFLIA